LIGLGAAGVAGWGTAAYLAFTRSPNLEPGAREAIAANQILGGDSPIGQALERRHSGGQDDFGGAAPDQATEQALAWAATGKNREGTGFVVPLAMHAEPYVSVYLADAVGSRQFSWRTNEFTTVSEGDARAEFVTQGFAKKAPLLMILVMDTSKIPGGEEAFGHMAVGAMTQNVYLLADEAGVEARYVASIDAEAITRVLTLDKTQVPVGAIVLAQR
jgi:hypothetical protein